MRPDGVNRTRAPRTGVVALGGRADESDLVDHRRFTQYTLHTTRARYGSLHRGSASKTAAARRHERRGPRAGMRLHCARRVEESPPLRRRRSALRCVRAARADTSCASQLPLARQFWSERVCVRSVRARR